MKRSLVLDGKTLRRREVKIEDYFGWLQDHSRQRACDRTSNPAFLDGSAPSYQVEAAQRTCAGCPLVEACNFFAHTKVFKEFDGVMGGALFEDKIEEQLAS